MQRNRVTNRVTKPASSVPSPVHAVPAPPLASTPLPDVDVESFSRSPGQHEELIDRVRNGFKETLRVLDEVAKQHQDVHVNVHLDTSVQKEILEVAKQIQIDVKLILEFVSKPPVPVPDPNAATKEEVDSILGPPIERLKGVGTPSQGAGKKKKNSK